MSSTHQQQQHSVAKETLWECECVFILWVGVHLNRVCYVCVCLWRCVSNGNAAYAPSSNFQTFEKEYLAKLQWNVFPHLQVTDVCNMSYNHSSMYYNLQETLHRGRSLEYKGLSLPLMLWSFPRHTSAVQCGSDMSALVNACLFQPHHNITRLCLLRIYIQNPSNLTKIRCHDLSREAKYYVLSHNIC